jgi:hypothetical protein
MARRACQTNSGSDYRIIPHLERKPLPTALGQQAALQHCWFTDRVTARRQTIEKIWRLFRDLDLRLPGPRDPMAGLR